jgi:hypothetical protein
VTWQEQVQWLPTLLDVPGEHLQAHKCCFSFDVKMSWQN